MDYHSGDQLIDAHLLLEKAQIQPGMHVADFGCGRTGHIVFPATRIIGDKGLVYAIDVMRDVLESIHKRAALGGLHSVETVWSDLERVGATAIAERTLDVVFIVNMLVHTDNRHAVLEEARRLLKDKARLVIADWKVKGLPFGPHDERLLDFSDIVDWARMHGYGVQEEFDMGKYHHGVVLFKI